MDIRDLKEEILNRELISDILAELGCHHIRDKGDYIQAGNRDGDNPSSIVVYKNEYISCINYTRQITKNGRTADIFDLIAYAEDCSFAEAMKFVCELAGIDYYGEREDLPESLQILRMLKDMAINDGEDDDCPVKPISEKILSYYLPYGNKMFEDDGISLEIQKEFKIGYDPQTNRITIPIRTPLGDLCGVKGRLFGDPDDYNPKYLYLEPTAKQKLLYGLYENKDYIKNSNYLVIFEAEKSVLQCASNGVRNCVAIGGKSISKTQAELIIRTGCTPIVALDKGIELDEIKTVMSVFPDNIPVYYIFDEDNIMCNKQSPVDDWNSWEILIKNNVYKK
jgi:DNA primase